MTDYQAPIEDMRFAATKLAGFNDIASLPGGDDLSEDLLESILEEGGKFAGGVLAPLNRVGDEQGSRLENGVVVNPDGWPEAYQQFVDGGWNSVPFEEEHGGQGLPWLVAATLQEMWQSANMAFALCPMLTQAAVEAISRYGSEDLKNRFLPKLVPGDWTGLMNLTEPQAGSDLAAIRTKAVKEGDHYRITGQKIFITYGDHEMTGNIIHSVLARTPDAPPGVKGISLFIVPKYLVGPDGEMGERNDLRCVSLEHKMGIHASPTAVISYGDNEGAIGWLVGEENMGLHYMFTMMNNARLSVGVQGLGVAERAFQKATAFAKERIQGKDMASDSQASAPIIRHPDVKRMLMTMKALTEAGRAVAYYAAGKLDIANRAQDADQQKAAQGVVDLLIPIVKGWCTEIGSEVASIGVQVHGGMGYIEETGAAQYMRDAKIAEIYEGTNGIQANDLMGRKVLRDGAATAKGVIAEMRATVDELAKGGEAVAVLGVPLDRAIGALEKATDWLLEQQKVDPRHGAAAAMDYLRLWGTVMGGWQMARAAAAANTDLEKGVGDPNFLRAKLLTARFYSDRILPRAYALEAAATSGAETITQMLDEAI